MQQKLVTSSLLFSNPSVAVDKTVAPSDAVSAASPMFFNPSALFDIPSDALPTSSNSLAVSDAAFPAAEIGFSKSSANFDSPNSLFAKSLLIFLFLKNLLTSTILSKSFIAERSSFLPPVFNVPVNDFFSNSGMPFAPIPSTDFPIFLYSSVV